MKSRKVLKKIMALSIGTAMLGATLTGALALDTNATTPSMNLADYPNQFIKNGVFSGLIVVGASAAASDNIGQSIILNDLATKAVTKVNSKAVVGNGEKSEEFSLGSGLDTEFSSITDTDVKSLLDGEINFDSKNYDTHEELKISDKVVVQTSLTANEDDYKDNVYLEVERDSIKYLYVFDESIDFTEDMVSSENPIDIKFLGKTLKITDVEDSKIVANVGTEYFMNVDDSVESEGKKITLKNVGTNDNVVVDVAGVSATIDGNTKTINGIEIKVDETFYTDAKAERSATLIIGKDAQETYNDEDAYVGEDEDNPNWVWTLDNLKTSGTSQILGIENDFVFNDDSDNPPTSGDCIELPNNYLKICFEGLNADTYSEYSFEYDDSADLSDVDDSLTKEKAIYLRSDSEEGFSIDGKKSDKVWLKPNGTDLLDVFYRDDGDSKIKLSSPVNITSQAKVLGINYGDKDLTIEAVKETSGNNVTLVMKSDVDTISSVWKISGNDIISLGMTSDSDEADELIYDTTTIGTKDDDLRTEYGVVIRDPSSEGSSDRVTLSVPEEKIKAVIGISGQSTGTTQSTITTGDAVKINPISSTVVVLDSEVASNGQGQNLILIGGSSVNKLVEPIFGLKPTDFTVNEAMVKLVKNGDKIALLCAGYEAVDTRNCAIALANGKFKNMAKSDAIVKSTALNEYTIN